MEKIWILCSVGILLQLNASWTTAAETYVTCLNCYDVKSPSDCREFRTCGKGEICYTREFTDHKGFQGFNLGCEVETRCTLFLNAAKIFGKRETNPTPEQCYECCSGNECNAHLCQGKDGAHSHNTYTECSSCPQTCCPITTCNNTGCPPYWPSNEDSCYYFATWNANWTAARAYCKGKDGDLVSINTQDEQQFLVNELGIIASSAFTSVWVGGSYYPAIREFEWVDRTPVVYTIWAPGEPGTLSHSNDHHIYMRNPNASSSYKEGPWVIATDDLLPFICEKKSM